MQTIVSGAKGWIAVSTPSATRLGAKVLVEPFTSDRRESAIVQFPGGYVAEIHAVAK